MGTTTTISALLDNGDDHRFRQFIYDSLAFGTRLEAVRNGLGALMGLTGPQYSILITIRMLEKEGSAPAVIDVADYMHVSGAFVTSEVNKLKKAGLVAKTADQNDRRRVLLALTEEAELRLRELTQYQTPVNDTLFGALSREEFEVLCSVLPKLVARGDAAVREVNYLLKRQGTLAG
jgi:DNA-binding MarR family transcriptional regulator